MKAMRSMPLAAKASKAQSRRRRPPTLAKHLGVSAVVGMSRWPRPAPGAADPDFAVHLRAALGSRRTLVVAVLSACPTPVPAWVTDPSAVDVLMPRPVDVGLLGRLLPRLAAAHGPAAP